DLRLADRFSRDGDPRADGLGIRSSSSLEHRVQERVQAGAVIARSRRVLRDPIAGVSCEQLDQRKKDLLLGSEMVVDQPGRQLRGVRDSLRRCPLIAVLCDDTEHSEHDLLAALFGVRWTRHIKLVDQPNNMSSSGRQTRESVKTAAPAMSPRIRAIDTP